MAVRVLCTGGAGFIGSHLVDALVADGHDVAILDSLVPQVHPACWRPSDAESGTAASGLRTFVAWPAWTSAHVMGGKASAWLGDVRDRSLVDAVLAQFRPQVVVHLASEVGVGQAEYEIERYVDANVRGTSVLLEAILAANDTAPSGDDAVRRLVVAGSMSAYGEGAWRCPTHGPVRPVRDPARLAAGQWDPVCPLHASDAGCPTPEAIEPISTPEWCSLRPTGVYAATKRDQEELSLMVAARRGMSTAVLRLFNVYGPRQAMSNPYTGVAAIFASRVLGGAAPRVYEDGGQARDFVHVSDVVEAFRLMVGDSDARLAMRWWGAEMAQGVFNVGTGLPTTVGEVAAIACRELGPLHEPDVTGEYRAGDVRSCVADPTRLRSLGWAPAVPTSTGLAELFRGFADGAPVSGPADREAAHRELVDRGLLRRAAADDAAEAATPDPGRWA